MHTVWYRYSSVSQYYQRKIRVTDQATVCSVSLVNTKLQLLQVFMLFVSYSIFPAKMFCFCYGARENF